MLCTSLAFVLVAAAKIVTVYEVVQGLMRYLMSLYLALGIGLVYVGSVLILFTTVDALASERFTPDPQLRSTAVAAGGGMIGLGVLLVPISLLGIGAAHKELPRRLRMYEGCATLLAFLFLGLCGLAAWVGTTRVDDFIDRTCRALVQFDPKGGSAPP